MSNSEGQVVIVTGASAGIGMATSLLLAGNGMKVVLAARREDRLDDLRRRIESEGGTALAVAADINSDVDRRRLVSLSLDAFGRVDSLVNNAGYGKRGPIELISIQDIKANFETNFFSLIALTQLVIPLMRKRRSGRIVNISSVAGRIARPLSSVYDSTKHALEAVNDGLRGELAPFGVRVILIEPGFIVTEFQDVADRVSSNVVKEAGPYAPFFRAMAKGFGRAKRMAGQPEEIAALVLKALTSSNPRPRYAAPGHAKLFLALKRFLPERLFDYILTKQVGVTAEELEREPPGTPNIKSEVTER